MAWSAATNPRGPPTGILAAGILSPVAGLVSKPREQRAPSKGILTAGILSPVADLLPRVKRSFSTQSLTDVTEYIGECCLYASCYHCIRRPSSGRFPGVAHSYRAVVSD